MGLTFKKNCPDLRNTKVVSIIEKLKSYDCKVSVSDPYASFRESKERYDISLIDFKKIVNFDAIVIAVDHDHYKNIGIPVWEKMLKQKG